MKHRFENHDLTTTHCGQFVDLTDDVLQAVERSEVQNGTVVVYSPHTTCAVLINERESGFVDDFQDMLEALIPQDRPYRHDDLEVRTEGLEDDDLHPNGWSHCRAALVGSASQSIPIVDGQPMLGRWQKVFFCELDRSRDRKVFIHVTGE